MIRDAAGADAGFVADIEGPGQAVIRWLAGNRTTALQAALHKLGARNRVEAIGKAGGACLL